jgi:uncharacterized protein YndB with AHSA1/START domain
MAGRNEPADRDFVITRVFDAPRDLVFKVWTSAEHLEHWFGPKGCTFHKAELDLRPGGSLLACMRSPDGRYMWGKWVFREIVVPERIVFVNSFSDQNGALTRHPMSPTWPLEMLTTITFAEEDGKTRLTLRWIPINATQDERKTFDSGRESMKMGWTGTFDALDTYLKSQKHAGK